jgi:acetamidase/formamidase
VLTIDSGDTVHFRTMDASWGLDGPSFMPGRTGFAPRSDQDGGHALCGPIALRGAKPGMTLAIHFDQLKVGPWGWTWVEEGHVFDWKLDEDRCIGRNQFGHEVTLRPFLGVIGMPPDEPGAHSTGPPRFCGGNLDCKELVEGTTLLLPIPVEGALISVGDGHATQGDGELNGTAIECPMERAVLTFELREDLHLTAPRALTSEGWLAFGLHTDLDEATEQAVQGIIEWIVAEHGVTSAEARALASLTVDLRITQIVNGVRGVHAVLPRGALRHFR